MTEKFHSNSKEEIQFYMQFYLYIAEEMKVLICGCSFGAVHPQMKHWVQQFILYLSILSFNHVEWNTTVMDGINVIGRGWNFFAILL